ncbi:DUF6266 family protein [Pedobacter gandavensis]|uniref:DUF6266 family protein n=1 Tax=Pedobacter gandavensis TaxID=2679963 RepID=UPI002478BD6A|nr:DUF6266 family protein [Pedobacter gandavensis]WGQ07528.1 DUF6266 family protein [Pedobacter gandavensis]
MGTYKPGVFGPFNGRVGDVVAARWKDINVVRNRPAKSSKPATLGQLDHRSRFGLVTAFAGKVADQIAVGFRQMTGNYTPTNIMTKAMMKNAITGIYPDYKLDYASISMSKDGSLDLGKNLSVQLLAGQTVQVSWVLDTMPGKVPGLTDKVYIMLYNSDKHKVIRSADGLVRGDTPITMYVPSSFVGDEVHCWVFFASVENKDVSPTAYLGVGTVLA